MIEEYFAIELSNSVRVALPLEDIEIFEHLQYMTICPIPGVAPFWLGVANQRGSLLWVLDTDRFFNLVPATDFQEQKLTAVVLKGSVMGTQRRVAWVVKKLSGQISFHPSQLKPLPVRVEPRFRSLCTAIVQEEDDKSIVILNSDAFFQELHK